MRLELHFPYSSTTLDDLTGRLKTLAPSENEIEILWFWQPFHAPFFSAAHYAAKQKWSLSFFEQQIGELSGVVAPARLKSFFEKKHLTDEEGCIRSLDLRQVMQESLAVVKNSALEASDRQMTRPLNLLDFFDNNRVRLLKVDELKTAFDKTGQRWVPDMQEPLATRFSAGFLSSVLIKNSSLLKTFHALDPWQKLSLLELLVGVAKCSSLVHFQRIDAPHS